MFLRLVSFCSLYNHTSSVLLLWMYSCSCCAQNALCDLALVVLLLLVYSHIAPVLGVLMLMMFSGTGCVHDSGLLLLMVCSGCTPAL
jgi:hypothetical protein